MTPDTPGTTAGQPASTPPGDNPEITTSVRLHKRKKTSNNPDNDAEAPNCFLGSLPLELLAEILSYTGPRDVLSVARTNKYFCATLVNNPSTEFVWKRARRSYVPAIPDPLPNFTEASYAAFLFDKGVCEACGKKTKAMYASFALRLRLCEKKACRQSWNDTQSIQITGYESDRYTSILKWLPRLESPDMGYAPTGIQLITIPRIIVRKSDWKRAMDDYNKAALSQPTLQLYKDSKAKATHRFKEFVATCKALIKWRNTHNEAAKAAQKSNLELSKRIADSHSWKLWDLIQSPTYGMLYRTKNICLEHIKAIDYEVIEPTVEAEILALGEARQRREDVQSYQQRLDDVKNYYLRMKGSIEKNNAVPPLPEFRKLPMVQRMQYKADNAPSAGIAHELKHSKIVGELIKEDVARWREAARTALAATLGYPAWKTTSHVKLHPVDRLTARFRCKKCDAHGEPRRWEGGCYTFAEACEHRCKRGGTARAKESWQADVFVPDEKAIDAIQQVLAFCEHGADHVKSVGDVAALGSRIACLSCPARIVMDFNTLVRHCHRHEKMKVAIVPEEEINSLAPFQPGLCTELTPHSKHAEQKRKAQIYRCRHCAYPRALVAADPEHMASTPAAADSAGSPDVSLVAAAGKKKLKSYGFDGLRSHVKEKHSIQWIGDEDFYADHSVPEE